VCAHARRARRRRAEDHRRAPAESRPSGIRHGHGKLSAHLDLREEKDREILRGLVRTPTCSRKATDGTLGSAAFHLKRSPNCGQASSSSRCARSVPCRAVGVAPRLRHRCATVSGTPPPGEVFPGAEPGPQFYPVSAIDYLTGYLMAFGAWWRGARRTLRRRELARCASRSRRWAAGSSSAARCGADSKTSRSNSRRPAELNAGR